MAKKQISVRIQTPNLWGNNFIDQAKLIVTIFSIGALAIIFGTITFFPESTGHWKLFGIITGVPGGIVFGVANYLVKNRWRELPFWMLLGSLIGTISGFICFSVIIPFAFALIFLTLATSSPEGTVTIAMSWVIYLIISVILIGLIGLYIFLTFKLATYKSNELNLLRQ